MTSPPSNSEHENSDDNNINVTFNQNAPTDSVNSEHSTEGRQATVSSPLSRSEIIQFNLIRIVFKKISIIMKLFWSRMVMHQVILSICLVIK